MMRPRLALSIRQPFAEQILRGIKTVEYRSMPTRIIGERVYIYASRKPADLSEYEKLGVAAGDLPTGVIVGTMEIERCTGRAGAYRWHIKAPVRMRRPIRPERTPNAVWFVPF